MSNIVKGMGWALAMLLVAVLQKQGWLDRASATTFFAIIPAMMVMTIQRPRCRWLHRTGEGAPQ